MVSKSVVVGIDLGACESYVAYVGKGIVDVVQNEVSKRPTSSLVGFTDRERLLGDAALAQIRSNAKNSCRNFKHLIGRKLDAKDLEMEHFWSTAKLCECEDGHAGYEVTYKNNSRKFSAVEVTAMYLTKLREVTERWCEARVSDVVIAVPSAFSDVQRQGVLDAAAIANINVLRIMNEHTATALEYGIYRSNDFDAEKPMVVAFCSMGNSLFSVSIVKFVRGRLTVICEKSDKVGGRELDECLMREFAAQFQKKTGSDPLSNKKAAFKLEDAVAKTKKVLSANYEAPVTVECLMEDEDFASQITREQLEQMCEPAIQKAKNVLNSCFAASGYTAEQIDAVEIVGGGSRVPWVRKVCSEAFGGKELSTTMNQEESVSRGCALQAAMLSPLYKVRDFKVEDSSPFALNIGWMGHGAQSTEKGENGNSEMETEGEFKSSTVFPAGSPLNLLKTLTFFRKEPFEIKAEFADPSILLPLTPKELGTFHIDVPEQKEAKKVKVRARLTIHGTFKIEGAQMLEEEEYEEVVKEKREIPQEAQEENVAENEAPAGEVDVEMKPDAEETPAEAENPTEEKEVSDVPDVPDENQAPETNVNGQKPADDGTEKTEKKQVGEKRALEKKFEWVDVKKMKKRTKRTDLKVSEFGRPGLSPDTLQKLRDQETAMQVETREIVETDEKKNDLEGYMFEMRDKCSETGEYASFISKGDREIFLGDLAKAEDWLYDTFDATKTMFIDRLDELRKVGDAVAWRSKEDGMRGEWIQAVQGTVVNYRTAAEKPSDKFDHIAPEKLASIATACGELEKWLLESKEKQAGLAKHEKPVLLCADMERKSQELARMADEILKEPKPKEEKKEEPPKEDAKEQEETTDKDAASPEVIGEDVPQNDKDDMDVD